MASERQGGSPRMARRAARLKRMRAPSIRLGVLFGIFISASFSVVSCVSDDPTSPGASSSDDGGAGSDGTSLGDGSAGGDSSTSGDGATTGDGATDPCAGESGCPASVDSSHLQLWLRGDQGLDCTNFRVTTWHDQSTHGRNATAALNPDGGPALAPECAVGQKINGLAVATFTDPPPAGGTAFDKSADETFRVDLGFLKGHEFTIAVVHQEAAYIFSSALLAFAQIPSPGCFSGQPQNAGGFALGLTHDTDAAAYYQSDIQCITNGSDGYRAPTTMQPQLVEYTFENATGYHIFVNGVESQLSVISNLDASAANLIGVTADGGENSLIGRMPDSLVNLRYKGNIGEIIAYDSALSSGDRFVVQTYLKTKWGFTF
jgi:hypothetical protein